DWIRKPELRPLFTLHALPLPLPQLVASWRDLRASANPFVELYGLTLFQRDLPARARFLYLVQALEALHGYEHQAKDEERAEEFKKERLAVIAEAETAGLAAESVKFLRDKPLDSLDRRLRELV